MTGPDRSIPRAVPATRLTRFSRLGGLATGIAGRVAVGGMRSLAQGKRPDLGQLVLTPENFSKIAARLSEMRGAAMKLGQLMSMESADLLPPDLALILARLRDAADIMPPSQLKTVLTQAYGADFRHHFKSFDVRPLAAASIGQVHRARARDGEDLAIKLQYPGVRAAIDSDLDNVAALIRWSGLWPRELDLGPLLAEARVQLHEEADYAREGRALARFGTLLADDPRFVVPRHRVDLSTEDALAMSFEAALPIEALAEESPARRDAAIASLIALCLQELFEFKVMQTDPNFANYRWRAGTGEIVLLDFGATREIDPDLSAGHLRLLRAGLGGMRADTMAALEEIGFVKPGLTEAHRDTILEMAEIGFAVLRGGSVFDFAGNDLADRLRRRGMEIGDERELWHIPPARTLFLQRKIGGLYLLATRIGATVDMGRIVRPYL